MARPDLNTVPVHLHEEINLVKQDSLDEAFRKYDNGISFLNSIPEDQWNYRYSNGKWSIRGVVQHVIDTERILCNRALVIARKDRDTRLLSFDEGQYGATCKADNRKKVDLVSELVAIQQSTKKLFESFDEEQLKTTGTVNNYVIDVNTLGFVVIGHTLHHWKILRE